MKTESLLTEGRKEEEDDEEQEKGERGYLPRACSHSFPCCRSVFIGFIDRRLPRKGNIIPYRAQAVRSISADALAARFSAQEAELARLEVPTGPGRENQEKVSVVCVNESLRTSFSGR